jgi:hypothetical protein
MAQDWKTDIPEFLTTPDRVESKIGALQFKDGYPVGETATKLRDEIDYLHGVEAFKNSIQGVSMYAIYKGFKDLDLKENEDVLLFSRLMNAKSLFLTGNADTVYYITFIDLSNGPIVFHAPPNALGIIDDMWFRWVTDFGIGGAERGKGGRYLLVGPGYDGPLPDGFLVRESASNERRFRMIRQSPSRCPPTYKWPTPRQSRPPSEDRSLKQVRSWTRPANFRSNRGRFGRVGLIDIALFNCAKSPDVRHTLEVGAADQGRSASSN